MFANRDLVLLSALLAFFVWGCSHTSPPEERVERHPKGRAEADVRFLADDLLEGRGTPSRGLDVAAVYLANQLRGAGWAPGVSDGNYLQPYEFSVFDQGAAEYRVLINGVPIPRDEYLYISMGLRPDQTPVEFDLVLAGYGVSVPEEGVDDFKDLDVAGKAVVALLGAPWELDPLGILDPAHAVGKSVQIFGRNGAMLVYVTAELSDPALTTPSAEIGFHAPFSTLPLAQLLENPRSMAFVPMLMIGPAVFDRVLAEAARGTYDELQARLTQGQSVAKALSATVRMEIVAETTRGTANNVIGILPGTDPALRDEWVILSAHYDALGVRPGVPPGEDAISNGADDDASGTAAVLETARRLAAAGPMKRSVMVALFSGEEKGLMGSAHYTAHPLAPLGQTVVNINVDQVGRSGGTVQALSPGSEGLFQTAVESGKAAGVTVIPDQNPTWRMSYYFDSYNFAKNDVSHITIFTANHEDYHQPGDEAEKIQFDELEKVVDMVTGLAEHYGRGAKKPNYRRPEWFLTPK